MRKTLLLLLILPLLTPIATAFSIEDATILFNGDELQYVGEREYPVVVEFTIDFENNEPADTIQLDLSSFLPGEAQNYVNLRASLEQSCRQIDNDGQRYKCGVGPELGNTTIALQPSPEQDTAQFSFGIRPEGASQYQTVTHSVTIDTEQPDVIYVGPEECSDLNETETCYINPNKNTEIQVLFEGGAFASAEAVSLLIGQNKRVTADSCQVVGQSDEGRIRTVCTATISSCLFQQSQQNEQCQNIDIPEPLVNCETLGGLTVDEDASQDMAGFKPQQNYVNELVCDGEAPTIHTVNIPEEALFTPDSTIPASINLSDNRNNTATIQARGRGVVIDSECEISEEPKQCDFEIEINDVEESDEARFRLLITDEMGNEATGEKTEQTIFLTSRVQVDLWSDGQLKEDLSAINSRTVQGIPRIVFPTFQFQKNMGTIGENEDGESLRVEGQTTLLQAQAGHNTQREEQQPEQCTVTSESTNNTPYQARVVVEGVNESGRVHSQVLLQGSRNRQDNEEFDTLDINCPLSLLSSDSSTIYTQGEQGDQRDAEEAL